MKNKTRFAVKDSNGATMALGKTYWDAWKSYQHKLGLTNQISGFVGALKLDGYTCFKVK